MSKNNQTISGLNRTVNLLYLFGSFFVVTSFAGLFYANTVKIDKINYLTHILDSSRINIPPTIPGNDNNHLHDTVFVHDTIQTISTITVHDTIKIHDTTYKTRNIYLGTKDSLNFIAQLTLCTNENKVLNEKTRILINDLRTTVSNTIKYNETIVNYNPSSLQLGTRKDSCCIQVSDIMKNVINKQMLYEMIRKEKALLEKYR